MTNSVKWIAALALAAAGIGCGSDSTSPGPSIAGHYTALTFVTTGTSGQTNQLTNGSSVDITLAANGTTSGHLHLAATGSSPAVDADMAGTWTETSNEVHFVQSADTFMRDMTFTVQLISNNVIYLVGSQVFSGTQFDLTLARGA